MNYGYTEVTPWATDKQKQKCNAYSVIWPLSAPAHKIGLVKCLRWQLEINSLSSGSLHTDRCCAYLSVQEPRVWRGSSTRPGKCLPAWTWDVASLKHMHNERISLIESLLEPRWLRLLFKGSEWKGSRRHGTMSFLFYFCAGFIWFCFEALFTMHSNAT